MYKGIRRVVPEPRRSLGPQEECGYGWLGDFGGDPSADPDQGDEGSALHPRKVIGHFFLLYVLRHNIPPTLVPLYRDI